MDGKHLVRFQSENSVFKFLQRGVDGKHLLRFQSENSVFKFLQWGVDGKHLMCFQGDIFVFKFLCCGVHVDRAYLGLQAKERFYVHSWSFVM